MPKDSFIVSKSCITKEDLLNLPLICSWQAMSEEQSNNVFTEWFGDDYKRLNVIATFNLVYNTALMVETGVGYALPLIRLPIPQKKVHYVSNLSIPL